MGDGLPHWVLGSIFQGRSWRLPARNWWQQAASCAFPLFSNPRVSEAFLLTHVKSPFDPTTTSFKLSRQKCDQLKRKHFVYRFSVKIPGSKNIGQCCRNEWLFMLLRSRLLNGCLWAHCGDHEPVGAQAVQTDAWPLIPMGFSQLKAVVFDRLLPHPSFPCRTTGMSCSIGTPRENTACVGCFVGTPPKKALHASGVPNTTTGWHHTKYSISFFGCK